MTRDETIAAAVALGAAGIGLVLIAMGNKGGGGTCINCCAALDGPCGPLNAGETLTRIGVDAFDAATAPYAVAIGQDFTCTDPHVHYEGPGRDAYTYFRIVQQYQGRWVTVQASGLSGTHLQPGNPGQVPLAGQLIASVWPGPDPAPINGKPPDPGPATLVIEIYERKSPNDGADGYAAPTYNRRIPVARTVWPNKIVYS